jgi:hypothetical protein
LLALLATGCPEPADLSNPEMYDKPPPAMTSGGSGGGGSSDACEVACVKKIVKDTCTLCHSSMLKSSELDLSGDGFTARLKGQPAKHIVASGACPSGDKLIDVDDPAKSWLLKKVKAQEAECGDPMPNPPLGATDQGCLEAYVYCVAGKPLPGGGSGGSGGSGAGGSSAGSGGSSSGGSGGSSGGKAGSSSGGSGGSSGGSGGSSSGNGGSGGN